MATNSQTPSLRAITAFHLTKLQIVDVLIKVFGINPLVKLISSSCDSPTVIAFGCRKVSVCFFFSESGFGVITGVGIGVGVGVFLTKDVNVGPFKSNDPGTQNLQRSVVLSGTSTATHG